jgi:hypothetical protein
MATMDNQTKEKEHYLKCPALDGILGRIRATPCRMPGWRVAYGCHDKRETGA